MPRIVRIGEKAAFALLVFAVLAAAILSRPPKWMSDFDQSFYLTIAYDLNHHGVFSNGIFDKVDSTAAVPPPGMFFGPLYPWLIVATTWIDPRFAKAVDCSVEANHQARPGTDCEVYARPIHLLHAALLTLGVLAIAGAAQAIFRRRAMFWLAGALAAAGLLADADLFAFIMTESVTFGLYGLTMLAAVMGWTEGRLRYFAMAGLGLGLLCLARPSFLVLALVLPVLFGLGARLLACPRGASPVRILAVFAFAFALVVGPWLARNAIVVGKAALTEEYGSAVLIERFAFNDMTAREFALAFPYCLPEVGEPLVAAMFGPQAMERFVYYTPKSFFHGGRAQRDALVKAHGRLDPLIADVIREEMRAGWWRHLLVSIPLGWCGMWVGGWLGLAFVPLFVWGCVAALRRPKPVFLLYAAPALAMLGLHALLANHYTRYNLILIGPFSLSAAWFMVWVAERVRWRSQAPAPER